MVGCCRGYLSAARCRLAYSPADVTVSCFSKIQIGFTFLVPVHPGSPGNRAVKRVCVCVCVRACVRACVCACVRVCTQTDVFEVRAVDLVNVTGVVVGHSDARVARGWFLHAVRVRVASSRHYWMFPLDRFADPLSTTSSVSVCPSVLYSCGTAVCHRCPSTSCKKVVKLNYIFSTENF